METEEKNKTSFLKEQLEGHERRIIFNVLQTVKNNKSKACEVLGIDRKTLYNKINKYSLILLVFALNSCALLTVGTTSKVKVTGVQDSCDVYINGNYAGTAPTRVKVTKKELKHGAIVIIKKEGFKDQQVILKRRMRAGSFVCDLLFMTPWLWVDFATGAIYRPYPNKIKFKLQKEK